MRYAIAPSFWPSIAFVLHHLAARKREKHEQHRIGVARDAACADLSRQFRAGPDLEEAGEDWKEQKSSNSTRKWS